MPATVRPVIRRRAPLRVLRAPFASNPPLPTFPEAPLDLSVAIYVDGSWIDITPSVYGQERADIQITRGRANEAGQVDRSRATWQVNNRDGQFSPRNPTSWLYGKIGRNTQVRIAVGADVRFSGEISEWPQRWDKSGRDVYVPIEASGILRRLGQGATPLKSTCYRGYTSATFTPVAYWPCEEEDGATEIASALGGPPMTFQGGTPDLASHTGFKCSSPLPTFNGSQWTGIVPAYSGTGSIQVFFLMQVPVAGALDEEGIIAVYTSGTAQRWSILYDSAGTGNLRIIATDAGGTATSPRGSSPTGVARSIGRAEMSVMVASPTVMRSPTTTAPPGNCRPLTLMGSTPLKRSTK